MIPLQHEQLIPLREAPKHLPPRANGKRLHLSAVYRWITKGVAGVVLESIRVGGTTYTSIESLQRFAVRLSRPDQHFPAPVPIVNGRTRRQNVQRALEVELGLPLETYLRTTERCLSQRRTSENTSQGHEMP